MTKRRIKCVTACEGFNGPDFDFCIIECTQVNIDNGEHYIAAKVAAISKEFDGPYVVFDEHDAPSFLMDHFVWETGDMYDILGNCIDPLTLSNLP